MQTLLFFAACDQGTPASPSFPVAEAGVSICANVDPTFDSIRTNLLDTNTCGAPRGGKCHSSGGAVNSGGLDFTVDASALYLELLGDAGTGGKAENISGDDRTLYRVVPGDAGGSFLYIKLTTQTGTDPHYGSGMPFDYPGQLCPPAIESVRKWIDDGAKLEEPDAAIDAGEADASDGGEDADLDAGDAGD